MPQGLQIFDGNGSITIDITDRITKVIDVIETEGKDGSRIDTNIGEGTFWCIPIYGTDFLAYEMMTLKPPVVTINGTTISWVYTDRNNWGTSPPYPINPKYMLLYGVY